MSNGPKTVVLPISLPSTLARQLDTAAKMEAMTRSEYVRSLIRRQMGFNAFRLLQEEASKRSKGAGIRTLRDAVRVARAVRAAN